MKFPSPLIQGKLIRRYKRFLADVELSSGEIITAHCANSGSLINLAVPGATVWVSQVPKAVQRKLRFDWHLIQDETSLVGINTSWANHLVEEAICSGTIFPDYQDYKREVKYGVNSRIDFLLSAFSRPQLYLEVKNVTHHHDNVALFPDSVTTRGAKHLKELSSMVGQGYRAGVIYIVQRADCRQFSIAEKIDSTYYHATLVARERGVEFWAYSCHINENEIKLDQPLMIKID